jgi:hypothetical protein
MWPILEKIESLFTRQEERDILIRVFLNQLLRHLENTAIESAAQTPVGSNHQQKHTIARTVFEKRMQVIVAPGDEMIHYIPKLMRIGTSGLNRILRLTQFGSGDQLHGLGHLLGVLDTPYSLFDVS